MFCNKCGNQINNNETVCPKCGNLINENESKPTVEFTNQQFMPQKNATYPQPQLIPKKKTIDVYNLFLLLSDILGLISGVLSIIFGINIKQHYYGLSYISSVSYGGDAYTGIQNAAADTGNNVISLFYIVKDGFVFLLIIIGLISISVFLTKLISAIKNLTKNK